MTTTAHAPHLALGGPTRWRAIDIVTLAITGVAFGVAFWVWDIALYPGVSAALEAFPPAKSLTLGVWLLPCVFGAFLVRRPGAALICEFVAATVEMGLGNAWGGGVLISAFLQALGVELVVAALIWRRWGLPVAMAGGAAAAVLELAAYEWWTYIAEFSWGWKFASLGFAVVSGVLVAGVGGWYLLRAMTGTGALDAFPPGRERLANRS